MSVLDHLRAFIEKEFLPDGGKESLQPDDDLFRKGILDSLVVLQVVNFMEQTYGIHIEDREIALENFKDLSSMARLVEQKNEIVGLGKGEKSPDLIPDR